MRSLAVLALLAAPAFGHGAEPQAGKFPYFDATSSTGLTGGGSSWGIVLPEDDHFGRVCEEAYSNAEFAELPSPPRQLNSSFSHLRSDGGVLIGGFGGTYITNDLGCTYTAVPFFAGQVSSAITVVGGRLLVATATLQGANGISESDDEGDTWSVLLPPIVDVTFFQLVSSADGTHVMASGSNTAAATVPAVFVSDDGGATFDDVSSGYAQYPLVRGATFDEDGNALLGGFNAQAKGIVLRAAPPYDAPEELLVDVTDPNVPDEFPAEITHVAVVPNGGGLVALARLRKIVYHQPVGGVFVDVTGPETGPTDCLFTHPDGQRVIGCGQEIATGGVGLFMESTDGVTWTETIGFGDVVYRRCPEDTVGALACAGQFESSCTDALDDDFDQLVDCDDPECADQCAGEGEGEGEGGADEGEGEGDEGEGEGDVTPPEGCGCASTTSDGALAALGALLLACVRVRRRR